MPDIEYTRVGWQNAPDMSTPLSATNLNTMENGIVAAVEAVNELRVQADNLEDDTELLENRVGILEESADNILNLIAPVEATNIAANAYEVGDHLLLSGILYKVTTAISVGDNISAGTNVETTTIMQAIIDAQPG